MTHPEHELHFFALDGTNPQGFLAALGVLDALTMAHEAEELTSPPPKLSWTYNGRWTAVFNTELWAADVVKQLDLDRQALLEHSKAVRFEFGDDGVRDLKAPPADFREFVIGAAGNPIDSDYAAAFGSEAIQDAKGNTKPTLLHFTSGRQKFLAIVRKIGESIGPAELTDALTRWRYTTRTPSLGWDATVCRNYALLSHDPSKSKTQLGNPGAEWLAFRGLRHFPCVPQGRRIATTCVHGHWQGKFVWPLWETPVPLTVVPYLLRLKLATYDDDWNPTVNADALRDRGISAVLESDIIRGEKGYGRIRPSQTLFARLL